MSKARILIVDDEAIILEKIKYLLVHEDFKVVGMAPSGEDAIRLAAEESPDLILMDIMMSSRLDGIDTVKQIQKKQDIPVIFLTASSSKEHIKRSESVSPYGYLVKPFHDRELIAAIQIALNKAEMERKLQESEERFKDFFRNAAVGFHIFGSDRIITDMNNTELALFGYDRDDIIGKKKWSDLIIPEQKLLFEEHWKELLTVHEVRNLEYTVLHKDGHPIDVLLNASARFDKAGNLINTRGSVIDITEKKKAEAELIESEKRFGVLSEAAFEGIGITDKGKVVDVSNQLAEMLGYNRSELIGIDAVQFVAPESRELVRKNILTRVEGPYEHKALKKDGTIIDVEANGRTIPYAGKIMRVTAIRDISDRKKAEETLKSSEERLKLLFESAPDAYYINDLNGTFIDGNKAAEELLDYKKEELIGKNFLKLNLLPMKELQKATELLSKNALGHSTGPDEFHLIRKDGSQVVVEIRTHPVKIGGEAVILGIARDITDRKQAEEVIKKQSAQRQRLLEMGRQLTSSLNIDKVLECVSEEIRVLLECNGVTIYMLEEDQGKMLKPVLAYDPPYEKQIMSANIDVDNSFTGQAIKTKKGLIFNFADSQPGGCHIPGTPVDEDHLIVVPFIIDKKAIGAITIYRRLKQFTDKDLALVETFTTYASTAINNAQVYQELMDQIAVRRGVEEQLRHAQKMEAIGQLAGGVAHDFNNKLGGIIGFAELALGSLDNQAALADYLAKIIERSDKSARLVRQLLAFSRQQILDLNKVDINRIILEASRFLTQVIGEHIDLQLELTREEQIINADPNAIDQIITNLCINARDAMPNGGNLILKTEKVVLDDDFCSRSQWIIPGDYIVFTITDSGHGMPADMIQHIFEPFYTTKGVGDGTGLGLSMVFGLVKQHHGYIDCNSEINRGTTFAIYFPIAATNDIAVDSVTEESTVYSGNEHILLAEDDEVLLEVIQTSLGNSGYTVFPARNGEDAFKIFKTNSSRIDLVISDVIMPDIGGTELHQMVRAINPTVKFLFLTGYASNKTLSVLPSDDDTGILNKPFKRLVLAEKIRELLN